MQVVLYFCPIIYVSDLTHRGGLIIQLNAPTISSALTDYECPFYSYYANVMSCLVNVILWGRDVAFAIGQLS